MVLTLTLPEELSESLTLQAQRLGLTPNGYALQVLQSSVPAAQRRERLIALLDTRIAAAELANYQDDDDSDAILRAIDEDRLSDRPLFPPELKGVTW